MAHRFSKVRVLQLSDGGFRCNSRPSTHCPPTLQVYSSTEHLSTSTPSNQSLSSSERSHSEEKEERWEARGVLSPVDGHRHLSSADRGPDGHRGRCEPTICIFFCHMRKWRDRLLICTTGNNTKRTKCVFGLLSYSLRPRASSSSSQSERSASPLVMNSTQSLDIMPRFAISAEEEGTAHQLHWRGLCVGTAYKH